MQHRKSIRQIALDNVTAHATRALIAFKRGDRELQLIEEAFAARWECRADELQRAGH
jgi:hypothetical protein